MLENAKAEETKRVAFLLRIKRVAFLLRIKKALPRVSLQQTTHPDTTNGELKRINKRHVRHWDKR